MYAHALFHNKGSVLLSRQGRHSLRFCFQSTSGINQEGAPALSPATSLSGVRTVKSPFFVKDQAVQESEGRVAVPLWPIPELSRCSLNCWPRPSLCYLRTLWTADHAHFRGLRFCGHLGSLWCHSQVPHSSVWDLSGCGLRHQQPGSHQFSLRRLLLRVNPFPIKSSLPGVGVGWGSGGGLIILPWKIKGKCDLLIRRWDTLMT